VYLKSGQAWFLYSPLSQGKMYRHGLQKFCVIEEQGKNLSETFRQKGMAEKRRGGRARKTRAVGRIL
jgi:hypothetical protein